jgi:glycosyltransferase involved in cell wall biosynthesis
MSPAMPRLRRLRRAYGDLVHGLARRLLPFVAAQDAEIEALRARALAWEEIRGVTALVRCAPPRNELVSVVLATRDRASVLPAALHSLLAQTHAHWEGLVVDDGSRDETPRVLDGITDPRLRRFRTDGLDVAAARNLALREARGGLVAYLDDDNLLDPDWLRAVVWAFGAYPEADVLYGAQVVSGDPWAPPPKPLDGSHVLRFESWDRERLEQDNFVDLGALAHRHPLAEAVFDESLNVCVDWDLLLRLSETRAPLRLPVISGVYRSLPIHRKMPTHDAGAARAAITERLSIRRARRGAR